MKEHLDNIANIIQEYESGAYITTEGLRDLLRSLTSQMYYLTKYKIEFKNKHNNIIHNREGSVAAAEVKAHYDCPELYLCRYILKAAQNVVQSIIMEISILKKD